MTLKTWACAALFASAMLAAPLAAQAQLAPIVSSAQTYGVNMAAAATLEIVPASPNKTTYATAMLIWPGGTGNVTFEYGTGTNCGTGTTAIGGAINLTAQAAFAPGDGTGPVIVVPAGKALCILLSANIQISGWITAAQF